MEKNKELGHKLADEVMANLQEVIMPYWLNRMSAPDGGFYGRRDGEDRLDADAPRGAILNARILWAFAAAYRVTGRQEYLDAAIRAKRQIIDRFYDPEYGGIYWSLNSDGTPLDTRKQFYAIGFAIYGLSELARATSDPEALDYALRLFDDIERHSRDTERGGYIEALDREWHPLEDMRLSEKDANTSKTMNTHLHILEPYTNLLRVAPECERLRKAIEHLLEVFGNIIAAPEYGGHLGLFFDNDWNRLDTMESYGHDIEASWLMLEAAEVLGNKEIIDAILPITRKIAIASLEGRNPDGSMVYEKENDGTLVRDIHWWVQAEQVVGLVYLYKHHAMPEMLEKAYLTWRYIADNMIDEEHGEWHWSIVDGNPNKKEDKAGFWKCPYHNSRMCLETYEQLKNS